MSTALERLSKKMNENLQAKVATHGESQLAAGQTMVQMNIANVVQAVQVQKPRDFAEVVQKVQFEAEIAPEELMYRWQVTKKNGEVEDVTGLSVNAANLLMRCYGNCAAWAELTTETQTHWIMTAFYVDRESGIVTSRFYPQPKEVDKFGKMAKDRAQIMKVQSGQSKAKRNCILEGMPLALRQMVKEVSERAIADQMLEGGMAESIKKVRKTFEKYGVEDRHLEKRIGKPIKEWVADDLVKLRQVYRSIVDGITDAQNEFGLAQERKDAVDNAFTQEDAAVKKEAVDNAKKDNSVNEENPPAETKKKRRSRKKADPEVKAEQPIAEQPIAEQPIAEQPIAEQPIAEQPMEMPAPGVVYDSGNDIPLPDEPPAGLSIKDAFDI